MKYEKNQYSEGFQICTWIIAAAFIWWGVESLWSSFFWNWWGIILVVIGISIVSGQIVALTNRGKLRNIVKSEFVQNPHITVEEINQNTGISFKDIKAIILDLKGSGQLHGKFSSSTGQIELISTPGQEPGIEQKEKFCAHCGTVKEEPGSSFCSHCGSKF